MNGSSQVPQWRPSSAGPLPIGLPFDNGSFTTTLAVPGAGAVLPLPGGGPDITALGPDYFAAIGTRPAPGRART